MIKFFDEGDKNFPSIHPLPHQWQNQKRTRNIHYLDTVNELWRLKRLIKRLVVDLPVVEGWDAAELFP